MTCKSLAHAVISFALLVSLSNLSWAEDGAALYKKKCAGCHGQQGEGKPAMKAPPLKGTSLSAEKVTEHLTKGEPSSKAPHNKAISGLTEEDAKAVAEFVKSLK
jgi:cytochrome c553